MPEETSLVLNVKSDKVEKATGSLKGFTSAAAKADKANDKLGRTSKATDKATDGLKGATDKATKATEKATRSQKDYEKSLKATSKSAIGLKIGIAALVAAGVSLAKTSLQNAAQLETLETSFVSLTGSVESAKATVKELADFTASTPFQLEGVAAAGRQLITARGSTEGLTKDLTKLGDIAATVGIPIQELAAIYVKAFNKGKIQAEELNQISERGIPIIRLLAEEYNVTTAAIFEMSAAGKLSFDDLNTAFTRMGEEGGLAFGAMERQSQTLNGKVSTLKDSFKLLTAELGKFASEGLKLNSLIGNFTELINLANERIQQGKHEEENAQARLESEKSLATLLEKELFYRQNIAKHAERYATTTGKLQTSIGKLWQLNRDSLSSIQDQLEAFDKQDVAIGRIREELSSISRELRKNTALSESERATLTKQQAVLKAQLGDYQNLIAAKSKLASIAVFTPAEATAVLAADKDLAERGAFEPQRNTEATLAASPVASRSKRATGGGGGGGGGSAGPSEFEMLAKDLRQQETAIEESYLKRLELIRRNTSAGSEIRLELEEKLAEQYQRESEDFAEHAASEIRFSSDKYTEQIQQLNDFYAQRKEIILSSTILTEREKNDAIAKLEEERSKTQATADKERFKRSVSSTQSFLGDLQNAAKIFGKKGAKIAKAAAIANATIDMARNTILAYQRGLEIPVVGTVLAPVFAATAAAAGAVQIAAIKSQPVGNYQQGGIIPGSSFQGDNLTANVNSAEMILNRQQQAKLFAMANGESGNKSSGGNVTIINQTKTPVEAETRQRQNGDTEIIIREAVNRTKLELTNEATAGGGTVVPALQRTFNLRRTGSY